MERFRLKDAFVCDFCRNICQGGCDELLREIESGNITNENRDLVGRKHRIKCLGRFCDKPCKFQDLSQYSDVDLSPFLETIHYLGERLNKEISQKEH